MDKDRGFVRFRDILPGGRLLTAQETADALSISTTKLAELTRMGEIACVRIGRSLRYDRADVKALVERKKTQA